MTTTKYKWGFLLLIGLVVLIFSLMQTVDGTIKATKPIIFDHPLHIDVGMSCDDCHSNMEHLSVGARAIPSHDDCASCHTVDDDQHCAMCHRDPDDPVGMPSKGEFYIGFAHNEHIKSGLNCEQCHSNLDKIDAVPAIPMMSDCQSCHLQMSASLSCEICHDGKRPLPQDHKMFTWKQTDHGLEARHPVSDCAVCHTQQSCNQCHQGINLTGTPHAPHWVFNHSVEVGFGAQCMSCHQTRSQCVDCHRKMLPIPHPIGAGYANRQDGGEHMLEFKMYTESCLSCHDVGTSKISTCARCHN